jgi:hypothetical protein
MPNINVNVNSETLMGVALIAFGAFTFAKGISQHITNENYVKSVQNISNLATTFTTLNNEVISDIKKK